MNVDAKILKRLAQLNQQYIKKIHSNTSKKKDSIRTQNSGGAWVAPLINPLPSAQVMTQVSKWSSFRLPAQ